MIDYTKEIFWNFSGHPEFKEDFVKVAVLQKSLVSNCETITPLETDFIYPESEIIEEQMRKDALTQGVQFTSISNLFYKEGEVYIPIDPVANSTMIQSGKKVLRVYQNLISW